MQVSVLIATRDRPAALRRCLASVAGQDYADLEVLVFDDASAVPIDEAAVVQEAGGRPVRFLHSAQRLGPIGCRNALMQHAHGDVFLVLDDDACLAHPDAVTRTVDAFRRHPDVGILAFKLIERLDGREHLLVPYRRRRLRRHPHLADEAGLVSHYLAGGHALRRAVIARCGLFEEGLCYGHEELDLSFRALDAGFQILYLPTVVAHHLPEAPAARWNAWKLYHSMRNRLRVACTYLPWRFLPVHLGVWLVLYGQRALLDWIPGAFAKALVDGLAQLKTLERHPIRAETIAYLKAHGGRLWH